MTRLEGLVYHAPDHYEHHLLTELKRSGREVTSSGALHFVAGREIPTCWHQNLWTQPWEIRFNSLSDAAAQLRSLGALWSPVFSGNFRKGALIQAKLPRLPERKKPFPIELPKGPMGAWTLVDESTVWASAVTSSPFPGGVPPLEENKTEPPSSAYLKLQEALTVLGRWPSVKDVCLDAGSSPGGWSWVLSRTGAHVHSVDRSPLDPRMDGVANLFFRTGNAFALQPTEFPEVTWLLSDVICYPSKLWDWLQPWLTQSKVKNFVVTVKMQGKDCDWPTLAKFAGVEGSRLLHLPHNKHELTWLLVRG